MVAQPHISLQAQHVARSLFSRWPHRARICRQPSETPSIATHLARARLYAAMYIRPARGTYAARKLRYDR
jgi:hypothetical protein